MDLLLLPLSTNDQTNFCSDNHAGMCPEALIAMQQASDSTCASYGADASTEEAVRVFQELFGLDTAAFFVTTGTAANTLAIAALTEPWQRILCHRHSHLAEDESTAPERITGCRVAVVDCQKDVTKLFPEDLERALYGLRGDVHQARAGVLSLTNASELGTVYTPTQMQDLCQTAHRLGLLVHVDGARFANAVAYLHTTLGIDPRQLCRSLTIEAGVDVMSFGGTKNGLALSEAVLFFRQRNDRRVERAIERFPYLRKSFGHLVSKHRFISAPFAYTLRHGIWLRHAAHANEMAQTLAHGFTQLDYPPLFTCEANSVFVKLPTDVNQYLRSHGYAYYDFNTPLGLAARFMCRFDSTTAAIQQLLAYLKPSA